MFYVYYQNQHIISFPTITQCRAYIDQHKLYGARIHDSIEGRRSEPQEQSSFARFDRSFSAIPHAKRFTSNRQPYASIPVAKPHGTQLLVGRKRRREED